MLEKRLEHDVLVRIHCTLNHRLAKTPGCADHDCVRKARFRVDREDDAGAGEIRADHPLDADRQCDFKMIKTLGLAIGDRSIGEERSVASATCVKQRGLADDVQESLLLTGEARLRQVFGSRAAVRTATPGLASPASAQNFE